MAATQHASSTATVTATANPATDTPQRPATLGPDYPNRQAATPEKMVASHAAIAATLATGTYLSQISHGLTGRYWTMASMPDSQQDADLRF